MNSRTYYDILGVSREATLQEITSAKNALAKVYHPDANMNQGIDTTACMQEILEAYRVLSNPESRHEYDKELGGGQIRVFRTFTVGPEDDEQAAPFVVYWNAACRLQETVDLAMEFLENNSQKKKRTFLFFRRKDAASEAEKQKHLNKLSVRAMQYITVLKEAGRIINLVKNGKIRHFFLIGGCDGAAPGRNYYTEFAKKTPSDTLILTLACGKYRINDLHLGEIDGLPRIMDMGQCNDAYSAIQVALALADAFHCSVNELPLTLVLSWYEQKAVCILLTLLYLGIRNILLGPTLPAFVSPNVLEVLKETYQLTPISTPEADLKRILG